MLRVAVLVLVVCCCSAVVLATDPDGGTTSKPPMQIQPPRPKINLTNLPNLGAQLIGLAVPANWREGDMVPIPAGRVLPAKK